LERISRHMCCGSARARRVRTICHCSAPGFVRESGPMTRTCFSVLTWIVWSASGRAAESGAAAEAVFLSGTRQPILEGRRRGEGYFSPDGKALIFQSEREPGNPFYQIYTLDLESGESRRVSPGTGKTTCAFFRPGSDEVVFATTHFDPEAITKPKAELEFPAAGKERRYAGAGQRIRRASGMAISSWNLPASKSPTSMLTPTPWTR